MATILGTQLGTVLGTPLGTAGNASQVAENAMLALAPSYQFRSDTYTLSSGNLATMPNRRGADSLTVTAGTLAEPAVSAAFAGARTVAFAGTQELRSSLPASAWKFLHDGTGYDAFFVGMRTGNTGGNQVLMTTRGGGGDPGHLLAATNNTAVATDLISNAAGTPVFNATLGGAWTLNTPGYVNSSYVEGMPQEYLGFANALVASTSDSAVVPSANDPFSTLYVGRNSALQPAIMELAEILIFTRRLNAEERQTVREYIAARYGIAAPERTYGRVLSLAPRYQFRASDAATSGGNVTSIPNALGTDSLAVAAGTLAAPAADPLFANASSLNFTGTQWLDSSLGAASWKFLHDGTGCEVFTVFTPTSLGVLFAVWASLPGVGTTEGSQNYVNTSGSWTGQTNNASSAIISASTATGLLTANAATYLDWAWGDNLPIEYQLFTRGSQSYNFNVATAPSVANGQVFRLGAQPVNAGFPANMKWCETLIFPRVLHEYERQLVREYIQQRYGIAAPTLAAPDRDVMSMLPYSWVRADAANVSGGKVLSFNDKARPGHTYAQGNGTLQAPTPASVAGFGNQLVVSPAGTAYYDSSLAPAAWTFAHAGVTGITAANVFQQGTSGRMLMTTWNGGSFPGIQVGGTTFAALTAAPANGAIVTDGGVGTGTPTFTKITHKTSLSPSAAFWRKGTRTVTQASDALALSSAVPPGPLRLFAYRNNTAVLDGLWADGLVFDRALTNAELARIDAYVLARYGIAA